MRLAIRTSGIKKATSGIEKKATSGIEKKATSGIEKRATSGITAAFISASRFEGRKAPADKPMRRGGCMLNFHPTGFRCTNPWAAKGKTRDNMFLSPSQTVCGDQARYDAVEPECKESCAILTDALAVCNGVFELPEISRGIAPPFHFWLSLFPARKWL